MTNTDKLKTLNLPLIPPNLDKDGDFTHGTNFVDVGVTTSDSSFFEKKGIGMSFTNSSLNVQLQMFKSSLNSICTSPSENQSSPVNFERVCTEPTLHTSDKVLCPPLLTVVKKMKMGWLTRRITNCFNPWINKEFTLEKHLQNAEFQPIIEDKKIKVDWLEMPPEIMGMISCRLPFKDYTTFRSVCKQWQLLPSYRSNMLTLFKSDFWLLFHGLNGSGKCYLYGTNIKHQKSCTFYLPDLEGATVMHSKFGWLIAHRNEHFFLYNFFTLTKINLPDHNIVPQAQACTFSTLPTRKDCNVFIVTRKSNSQVEISSCRIGDINWEVKLLDYKSRPNSKVTIYCCCCSEDCRNCSCGLKNYALGIFNKRKYVKYDFVRKRVTKLGSEPVLLRILRFFQLNNDFLPMNRGSNIDFLAMNKGEWKERFGSDEGFMVDICPLSYKFRDYVIGLKNNQWIFTANVDFFHKLNIIKLAIIDPKYFKIKSK